MFTVKATYRGETRKFTFESNSFPTYQELYNQVRVSTPPVVDMAAYHPTIPP